MNKSYVGMGYSLCPVCGQKHSEVTLLDKRLRETLDREQCVDTRMCPEHQKLADEGYIALVVAEETTKMRTGDLVHVKKDTFNKLFNFEAEHSLYYIEPDVFTKLKSITQHE